METLIDKVVGGFLSAIQAGTLTIAPFGVGALGVLAVIAYGTRQWPLVMSSGAGLGDALAGFLLLVMGVLPIGLRDIWAFRALHSSLHE